MSSAANAIGVALPVDAFVMVANDRGDVVVCGHFSQNPFADRGVLLHLSPLLERKRAVLPEKTRRESDLPDVVYESAKECSIALVRRQAHATGDVSAVDRYRTRVTSRVRVTRLESGHECDGEGKVRLLKGLVGSSELVTKRSLALVQRVQPLECEGGNDEEKNRDR